MYCETVVKFVNIKRKKTTKLDDVKIVKTFS